MPKASAKQIRRMRSVSVGDGAARAQSEDPHRQSRRNRPLGDQNRLRGHRHRRGLLRPRCQRPPCARAGCRPWPWAGEPSAGLPAHRQAAGRRHAPAPMPYCPGYGFLGEDEPDFAQAVVGAEPDLDRPAARRHRCTGQQGQCRGRWAQAHGMPCLPGYAGEDQRDEQLAAEAARIEHAPHGQGCGGRRRARHALVNTQYWHRCPLTLASAQSEALAGLAASATCSSNAH